MTTNLLETNGRTKWQYVDGVISNRWRKVRWIIALFLATTGSSWIGWADEAPPRPNIVFILADDVGFEQLGCYGGVSYQNSRQTLGPVKTPYVDGLAKTGIRFAHCFCEPCCSPSRAEFLTGQYNFRSGFVSIAGRYGAPGTLDEKAHPTLAASLKAAGYVTAITGKWHLGKWVGLDREVQESTQGIPPTPNVDTDFPHVKACGFDRQFVFSGSRLEHYGPPTPEGYVPARFENWALRFLESRKGKPEPFFLYFASPIPHVPLTPTPLSPDAQKGDLAYPGLMEYLDKQTGDILKKLDELGLRENTLVIYSGDNGTCNITTKMRDGSLVKGGKGTVLDTGSWVPLVLSWPAKIHEGSVFNGLIQYPDLMPTFLELAGAVAPPGLDGISFAPQLLGKKPKATREWVHVLIASEKIEGAGDPESAKGNKKIKGTKPDVKIFFFVRDDKWKLRENGELFDISKSPATETLVPADRDTPESKAARERLGVVLRRLHGQSVAPVIPEEK